MGNKYWKQISYHECVYTCNYLIQEVIECLTICMFWLQKLHSLFHSLNFKLHCNSICLYSSEQNFIKRQGYTMIIAFANLVAPEIAAFFIFIRLYYLLLSLRDPSTGLKSPSLAAKYNLARNVYSTTKVFTMSLIAMFVLANKCFLALQNLAMYCSAI